MNEENNVLIFAKNNGFKRVKKVDYEWNNYRVYQAFITDTQNGITGIAVFIVVKEGEMRFCSTEEAREILRFLCQFYKED